MTMTMTMTAVVFSLGIALVQLSLPERMQEALALMDAGESETARPILESIISQAPSHGPARLALGQIAVAREDWKEARGHLEIAVRSSLKRLFLAWHLLGRARRAGGDVAGAKEAFERSFALAPEFLAPRLQRAELADAEGDLWTALAQYRRAADDQAVQGALANVARRMGATELARCAASKAGEDGAAYYLRAVIEEQAGNTVEAIAHAERALALGYDNAAVHLTLGNLHHESMNLSAAIAAFERALAIDPAAAESLASFALTSLTTEDYTRLRGLLERHTTAHPDSLNTLYALGGMYLRENALDEARRVFERLATLVPHASQVHYNLAMVFARSHDARSADAMARFRELKALEDANWERENAIHRQRLERDDAGEPAERERLAAEVVAAGGKETHDLVQWGLALADLGRHDEATARLEDALAQSPYERAVLEALGLEEKLALIDPEPECAP